MSTTQDVIKGRLITLEQSLESTEEHRARLIQAIRRARSLLRQYEADAGDTDFNSAMKTLDNALGFVDRRRRAE